MNLHEELLVPDYLHASKVIYDTVRIPFGSMTWQLLPLAEGYALLLNSHEYSQAELERLLYILIRLKKPILIHNPDGHTARIVRGFHRRYRRMEIIEVEDRRASLFDPHDGVDSSTPMRSVWAVLPHEYIRRRVVQQRALEYDLINGQNMPAKQTVHVVGIGPDRTLHTQKAIDIIAQAPLLVTFDFVYQLIKDVGFQGELHVLEYNWERYEANIDCINDKLLQLHKEGHHQVTLVVEGNPEVYDLLSYLSLADRNFHFEVIAPAIVLCCTWVMQHYGINITDPSYVIVSAYNERHGISDGHLASDMETYLRLDATCLIIELYSGELSIIFQEAQAAQRAKTIILFVDMFTPAQQVFVLAGEDAHCIDWVERMKGKFTSIAIVDEARLLRQPALYTRLLQGCAPEEERMVSGE